MFQPAVIFLGLGVASRLFPQVEETIGEGRSRAQLRDNNTESGSPGINGSVPEPFRCGVAVGSRLAPLGTNHGVCVGGQPQTSVDRRPGYIRRPDTSDGGPSDENSGTG